MRTIIRYLNGCMYVHKKVCVETDYIVWEGTTGLVKLERVYFWHHQVLTFVLTRRKVGWKLAGSSCQLWRGRRSCCNSWRRWRRCGRVLAVVSHETTVLVIVTRIDYLGWEFFVDKIWSVSVGRFGSCGVTIRLRSRRCFVWIVRCRVLGVCFQTVTIDESAKEGCCCTLSLLK